MTTVPQVKTVTLTIDGVQVTVPEGTLVIRAAEEAGIQVPRFCDHPLLDPVGACRQCLVDIPDAGNGRGFPKPQASCTIPVAEGMVVATSNPTAVKAQQGIMEFLLVNHPLDCPVCDKGGECPLQNQAMSNGRTETRFDGVKRTFPKPIPVSANILLDRERCVLCARCTRFADQVPGDPSLVLIERGARQQVGTAEGVPFSSYFSGNVIQICPVGALTSAEYRFRARPFDLVSTPSVAEHDACGAAIRVDHRRGKVMRRLAGDDPEVNQEWISDKDRFGFRYATQDRLSYPQIREDTSTGSARRGELRPASWLEAFAVAARGLAGLRAGVLPGGRLTLEEARAYADFAVQLGAPVDFRSRPHSAEEATFLRSYRASVTYADLEAAGTVVLVGLEPEDEAGTIFLRLREAVRKHGVRVVSVAPFTTYGASKLSATLVRTAPGEEAAALGGLSLGVGDVILAGERLALSPGALAAAAALAERTGAKLAWVPRRAGEMGAIEAGLLPAEGALDGDGIIAAAASGELEALVVGGVDPADTSDPAAFLAALEAARFVVSLEQRPTAVTALADVVLPVAAVVEKSGTFVTWDGRHRTFGHVLQNPNALPDARVLAEILAARPATSGEQSPTAAVPDRSPQSEAPVGTVHGRFKLATWKLMLDHGTLQQGDKGLAATARPAIVRLSPDVYRTFGPTVTIRGDRGEWTLPAEPADLADDVVWVPANSFGGGVLADLASPGSTVEISTASTDEELA